MLSLFSRVQYFASLWTKTRQALLPMGFTRYEYWSGLSFPPLDDIPNPGMCPALASRLFTVPPVIPSSILKF